MESLPEREIKELSFAYVTFWTYSIRPVMLDKIRLILNAEMIFYYKCIAFTYLSFFYYSIYTLLNESLKNKNRKKLLKSGIIMLVVLTSFLFLTTDYVPFLFLKIFAMITFFFNASLIVSLLVASLAVISFIIFIPFILFDKDQKEQLKLKTKKRTYKILTLLKSRKNINKEKDIINKKREKLIYELKNIQNKNLVLFEDILNDKHSLNTLIELYENKKNNYKKVDYSPKWVEELLTKFEEKEAMNRIDKIRFLMNQRFDEIRINNN